MSEELITNANPFDDPSFFRKERFAHYPELEIKDLLDIDDPTPIWEGEFKDTEGVPFHVYTLGGWLVKKGAMPLRLEWSDAAGVKHGRTVGGDVIIITLPKRAEADDMARDGLLHTLTDFARASEVLANQHRQGIILTSEIRAKH